MSPAPNTSRSRSITRLPGKTKIILICLSAPAQPYLLIQRQFEDDDGGVCYLETHDHDTYSGHFPLRLVEFTPTRLVIEIGRREHKHVEVTYKLDAKRFREVKRIVHIIFGVQG
jgi:hypothetical protein